MRSAGGGRSLNATVPRAVVECAFTDTGPTLDQELRDTLPVRLTDALPDVAPAMAFTAWLLASRGYSVRDLSTCLPSPQGKAE